jgi:Uma2 family endonuclease
MTKREGFMVVAVPPIRMTAADLLRHPEEKRYELIRGQLVEKEMSKKSSWCGLRLGGRLEAFVERKRLGWVFGADQGFTCFDDPGMVRKPDASFIALGRMSVDEFEEEGYCPIAPDLAVEVISPNDLSYDVEQKRDLWLDAGVRLVWIVNPKQKTVSVHSRTGETALLRPGGTLDGGEVLPGFSLPLDELFRLPAAA